MYKQSIHWIQEKLQNDIFFDIFPRCFDNVSEHSFLHEKKEE